MIYSHAYLGVDYTNLFICHLYFLFSPVNQWNHIIYWMLIIYLVKLWYGMVEIRCYPGMMCIFSNVTGYHSMYHVYQSTHEFECKLELNLSMNLNSNSLKKKSVYIVLQLWTHHCSPHPWFHIILLCVYNHDKSPIVQSLYILIIKLSKDYRLARQFKVCSPLLASESCQLTTIY